MTLRPPSYPSTPSAFTTPSTAITTPSPTQPRLLTPSGLRDVRIPDERISPELAAGLAMTTLETVLFLKGQIPMPIQQMVILGESGKNSRTVKKRVDLLQTMDMLSSHLQTTFLQLSAAFARRSEPRKMRQETERAYMLFNIGPPTGQTKDRVLLELEGMEVKDWGKKTSDVDEDDEIGEVEAEDEPEAIQEEDEAIDGNSSDSSSNPPSPSPYPPHLASSLSPPNTRSRPHPTRLLALALINLSQSSAPPTHVHLLLRAPRRFSHASWAPRQTMTKSLEGACFGLSGGPVSKAKSKAQLERVTVISTRPPLSLPLCPVIPKAVTVVAAEDEDDEMIWFEWSGKLTGFMDL